jgi:hypothetical protein
MTKKLLTILSLVFLVSCQSILAKEQVKTAKASSASGRINASDNNSSGILKELDE